MIARAAAASALALLISGDPARLGWGAAGLWHFVFPYLWLFVLLESTRARRRTDDAVAFLAGAAMAMLYGGVYAKDLQHGAHPFGVDLLGALCAAFDGGMTTVLALHIVERLRPRRDGAPPEMGLLVMGFLVFGLGAAAAVYGVKTGFNFYRADRMLGPTWLVADLIFAAAAWKFARLARAVSEAEDEPEGGREPWLWALAAFAVWLPGARLIARACMAAELPSVLMYFFTGAWTLAAGVLFWRLWRERGHAELAPVSGSRPALAAAVWRAVGALLIVLTLGAELNDGRAGGIFASAIDWP
ncbi:MAG: hypothetical protein Q7J64_02220, partial [Elusimicrobiota bacterium]|nr:hypothetical protein [Elusimicrobiota bacterium]